MSLAAILGLSPHETGDLALGLFRNNPFLKIAHWAAMRFLTIFDDFWVLGYLWTHNPFLHLAQRNSRRGLQMVIATFVNNDIQCLKNLELAPCSVFDI
jgi:hypothetical protein